MKASIDCTFIKMRCPNEATTAPLAHIHNCSNYKPETPSSICQI